MFRSAGPKPGPKTGLTVVSIALTGLLAGCGGSASAGTTAASSAAPSASSARLISPAAANPKSVATIHISKFKFLVPASVSPGSTVTVMNMDGEAHTVTANNGMSFNLKAPPGVTVAFTAPTRAGKYPFHCNYHSEMNSVLVVK